MSTVVVSRGDERLGFAGAASITFAPLGIPTCVIADDPLLLDAAVARLARSFGHDQGTNPEITIHLRRNGIAAAKVGFSTAVEGSSLRLAGGGVSGWADAALGRAECELSLELAGDVAETLLLFLLTRRGRLPIHASAVMMGETALLLAGRSGSGKSSLALAAERHGLEVLSEDTTYVELNPKLRAWGWPGPIHLAASDAPAGSFPERLRGGRRKLAVPRSGERLSADRVQLVAIEPGDTLKLERAGRDWLVERLAPGEPGFSLLREPIEQALAKIAGAGGWRLTLSRDPDAAIALLRSKFGR
jgi:hypothetical protein